MSDLIPTPEGATELTRLRGLRRKVFRLADGRRKIVARLAPVHYEDEGTLKDIDLNLRAENGEVVADKLPFRFRLHQTGIGFDYESRQGGMARVSLVGIDGQNFDRSLVYPSTRDRSQLTFADVRSGMDIVLRVSPVGLRAFRVLHNSSAPRRFRWAVEYDEAGEGKINKEIHGRDDLHRRLQLGIVNSEPQLQPSGRWRYFADETWNGNVRVVDPETRIASWQDAAEYPVWIDPDITEEITTGSDDASGSVGGTTLTATTLLQTDSVSSGFRFQSIAVDNAETIALAELKIYVTSSGSGGREVNWHGWDTDDSPTWGPPNYIPSVTRTTASTNMAKSGTTGSRTIDVTAIVQEIVDRAGWANGNDLSLLGIGTGTYGFLYIEALENAGTNHAVLEITLAGGGGAGAARRLTLLGVG